MQQSDTAQDLALPLGSLILITGTTGFLGAHVAQQALAKGYRVRGTVRSAIKADSTVKFFGSSNYEAVVVPDMSSPAAFDEAIRGVDGVIHVASPVDFSPDPNTVIPVAIKGATGVLKAAAKEPGVKRFVYTSSSSATTTPKPGQRFKINRDMWNDEAVSAAWAPPPYNQDRGFQVYATSKTESERAVWKFVNDNKPPFVVNTVLPNLLTGRLIENATSPTAKCVPAVLKGNVPYKEVPVQWMIDVIDAARIHVAALIDRSIANERIFAFDRPFNWNDVVDAVNKVRPEANVNHVPDHGNDLSEVDNGLGALLLEKWWAQKGYKGLEQSVRENLEGVE